jgi:hypothetical protein
MMTAGSRGSTPAISTRVTIALVAPALVGTGLVLGVACAEMSGGTPLAIVPQNIAEAAAMGNAADTLWFLQQGHDPRRIEPVRPAIISPEITRITALEGAVWSRQSELMALLDRWGGIPVDGRRELGCLAVDVGADDVAGYLDADAACDAGSAQQRVVSRASGAPAR